MLVRVHCLLGWHGIVVGLTSTQLFMLQGNLIILSLKNLSFLRMLWLLKLRATVTLPRLKTERSNQRYVFFHNHVVFTLNLFR